jgi:hypothetical protein
MDAKSYELKEIVSAQLGAKDVSKNIHAAPRSASVRERHYNVISLATDTSEMGHVGANQNAAKSDGSNQRLHIYPVSSLNRTDD